MKSKRMGDKMNKEQSADDPSVDLIRVKNMLNSTISMSYPDVVIAYGSIVSLKHSGNWWHCVKHDNNVKDYSWWLTSHNANHSNYLVCDEANRSLSLSGKW